MVGVFKLGAACALLFAASAALPFAARSGVAQSQPVEPSLTLARTQGPPDMDVAFEGEGWPGTSQNLRVRNLERFIAPADLWQGQLESRDLVIDGGRVSGTVHIPSEAYDTVPVQVCVDYVPPPVDIPAAPPPAADQPRRSASARLIMAGAQEPLATRCLTALYQVTPALLTAPGSGAPGTRLTVQLSGVPTALSQSPWVVWWHDPLEPGTPQEIGTTSLPTGGTASGTAGVPDDAAEGDSAMTVCPVSPQDEPALTRIWCPRAGFQVLAQPPTTTTTTAAPTTSTTALTTTTEAPPDTTEAATTTEGAPDTTPPPVVPTTVPPTTRQPPPGGDGPGILLVGGLGLAILALLATIVRWRRSRRREGPPPIPPSVPPTAPPPTLPLVPERWVEARLFATVGDTEVPVEYFRPGTAHRIEVRLGPDLAETGIGGERDIRVVLTEPRLLHQPGAELLRIGPGGASTSASFHLDTRDDTRSVAARLVAVDGGRIVHTAVLPTAVGPAPSAAAVNVATVETVVRAVTTTPHQSTFDAAVLLAEGSTTLTGIAADGSARLVALGDADLRTLDRIRSRLAEIAEAPDDFSALDAPGTRELLVFLANHGVLLRSTIVDLFLGQDLAGARALQIVSAMFNAFLPLELCYDFPAPDADAAVCPDADAALHSTAPAAACPGRHAADVVCPFGFWAVTKVIERHAYQPRPDLPSGFLVSAQPVDGRDTLPLANGALIAASHRVDAIAAGAVAGLVETVTAAAGSAPLSESWAAWDSHVASLAPATLVLLPHTVFSEEIGLHGMEIGAGDRRLASQIARSAVPSSPSIVALLGCNTAVAGDAAYEEFPARFRLAGASIVIATFTEVLGRHAAPLAGLLVTLLHESAAQGPAQVGEVMLTLRRRLLAEGVPAVLTLGVFGDADWLIGPPP